MISCKRKITGFAKDYKRTILIMTVFLLLGIMSGSVCSTVISADKLDAAGETTELLLNNGIDKGKSGLLFLSAFKKNIIPFILIWVSGFSVFLIPAVLGVLFFKGALTGFATGVLIRLFSLKGLAISMGATALANLIFIPALVFCGVFSIQNAVKFRKIRNNKTEKKKLLTQNIAVLGGLVLAAIVCGFTESHILAKIIIPIIA